MRGSVLENAEKMVRYFQGLADSEGSGWQRQLLVAQVWSALIQSDVVVSRTEFLALARDTSSGGDLGTAYDELLFMIDKWSKL